MSCLVFDFKRLFWGIVEMALSVKRFAEKPSFIDSKLKSAEATFNEGV